MILLKTTLRRSYLPSTQFVPTHPVELLSNYWFNRNESNVIFDIFIFSDEKSCEEVVRIYKRLQVISSRG